MIPPSRLLLLRQVPIYTANRGFASPALGQFRDILSNQLTAIKDAGTYKSERVITSSVMKNTEISLGGRKRSVLNFCANNYLGLAVSSTLISFLQLQLAPI